MKLSCEIVKDLLPLYEDGLCSRESRMAVEEHLEQCTSCAGECGQVRALKIPEIDPLQPKQEKAVAKSFRKVRRRWVASVLLVIVLLPLLACAGLLGWNQYREEGICYTNLDEMALAWEFAKLLEQGEFAQAAEYLDHTGDYESIHEALEMTWEDNMPNVQQVQIGEETWMVDPEFAERYLRDTPEQTWMNLIYNGGELALIPTELFRTAVKEAGSEGHWDETIYEMGNGYTYASFKTQWGSFMVEQNYWSQIMEYSDDPVMLCYLFNLYPLRLYQDNLEQLESYAKEQWQSSQSWNAPYGDMTLEEYTAYENESFVQTLEECYAQGIRIEVKGIHGAYRVGKSWVIQMELQASKKGQSLRVFPHISVQDGKLYIGAASHTPDAPYWIDDLLDALMI